MKTGTCLQCGKVATKRGARWKFCSPECSWAYRSGEGLKVYKKNQPYTLEKATEKFWEKVKKSDGCWEWQGNVCVPARGGYGVCTWQGKIMQKAHRIAWMLTHGEMPPPQVKVRHGCDNPLCVRPDHLSLGSDTDNVQDTWERGRAGKPPRPRMTQEKAEEIRSLFASGIPQKELAQKFGMHPSSISLIVARKTWSSPTF